MNSQLDPEAAETVQTTDSPAVAAAANCSALVLQSAESSRVTGWGMRARRGRFAIHSEARPAVILLENVEWTSRIPRNAVEADHINREAKRLSSPNDLAQTRRAGD